MLEDDPRAGAFAEHIPDGFSKRPRAFRPLTVRLRVLGIGHHAPMRELTAIDDADGPMLHAELALAVIRDNGNGAATHRARDLERHAAESARRTPDQHDVVGLDDVRWPSHQHA